MTSEQSELTLGQAQERVLAGLAERWPSAPLRISEDKTVTCRFGWIFTLDVTFVGKASDRISGHPLPTLVLVDKRSTQVIATSKPSTAAQLKPPSRGIHGAGTIQQLQHLQRRMQARP